MAAEKKKTRTGDILFLKESRKKITGAGSLCTGLSISAGLFFSFGLAAVVQSIVVILNPQLVYKQNAPYNKQNENDIHNPLH